MNFLGYLKSARRVFNQYKELGEKSFEQLADEKLFIAVSEESNSIAVIVKHLSGNMRSRWTDFLTTDGEKEWRNRDEEFENDIETRDKLLWVWNSGWNCLFEALDSISDNDLSKRVYIRNQEHTVLEAINRQLAHYSYHIGQIVFLGKMLCNHPWKSLSIPRGESKQFNAEKFSRPK